MTNADKIRSMSDEELAKFLTDGIEDLDAVDHFEDCCEMQRTFLLDVPYDKQSTVPHKTMWFYLQQEAAQ